FLFGDYPAHCISTGKMGQELPAAGQEVFLPSMVTSLILTKDVSIKWDNWQTDWEQQTSGTAAGASIGWGPFSLKGKGEHRKDEYDWDTDNTGEWLRCPGIQWVGTVSEILPACPAHASSEFMQP
ncbi:hypothetical protein AB0M20_16665, partial [Actinoplanes sp. NPDC051633]|uniref:hypothetical protein n=1 Tax=Actinoplanes sp. NPDC051633 TaxID=3155670 RepID=UPI00341D6B95